MGHLDLRRHGQRFFGLIIVPRLRFVVDRDSCIVTNYHVIEDAPEVRSRFSGDDRVQARVVGSDPSTDHRSPQDRREFPRSDSPPPRQLRRGARRGRGRRHRGAGLERSVTAGIVSGALQRNITAPNGYTISKVIQIDAPINRGNSGGPLLNANGEVIGVNARRSRSETGGNMGIGFAVPANTVREVVSQIKQHGKVSLPTSAWRCRRSPRARRDGQPARRRRRPHRQGGRAGPPPRPIEQRRSVIVDGGSYVLGGDIVVNTDSRRCRRPTTCAH